MLWSLREIQEYANYKDWTARKIVAQPDFPRPIRWMPGADPRWEDEEVMEWFRARKD